jgi:hypothetical protein
VLVRVRPLSAGIRENDEVYRLTETHHLTHHSGAVDAAAEGYRDHPCPFRFSIIARTAGVASLTTLTAQVKAIRISGVHEPVGGPVFGRNGDGLDGGDGRSILHLPWANST